MRKLRCDVKSREVVKLEDRRTNKGTFEIANVEEKLTTFHEQSPHNVDGSKCIMMMMENNFTLKSGVERRNLSGANPSTHSKITTILFTSRTGFVQG